MPKKKAAGLPDLPKYIQPDAPDLKRIVDVLEMLARQSGVGEIKEKVEELRAALKG